MTTRGEHLVRADRAFATGGGWVTRLAAPAFARVLDQIDGKLDRGGLDVTLPDGTRRRTFSSCQMTTSAPVSLARPRVWAVFPDARCTI